MYSIYADNVCIYNDISPIESLKLGSPKLIMEDSAAGSLTMTVPVTNVGYSLIERLKTDITVYRNGSEIWAGRVLTEDMDFWNNRVLYCEGELAFFNDSTQPQAEYHDITVRGFLQVLIDIHNAKVEENRRFTLGAVTVTDPNNSLYRYTNYEKTIECINEKLIERLGGHLRIRKVNGVRYLDYLADSPNTSSQVIEFGKNLMDFTKNWDMTEYATVILPLGGQLDESPIEALEAYLTVESVNDGSKYVASASAVSNYGWIEKVVHWDDVNTPSILLNKARQYLSDIQFDKVTIELQALDLNYMDIQVEDVKLLDRIRVVSKPHGMDRYFPVKKLEIPLDKPQDTVFTLGDTIRTSLTSVNNKTNSDILKKIDEIPKKHQMLDEAKANATAIMKMATTGYITIVQDEHGSDALYVSDTRELEHATKMWKLFMGGFGYSNDGGETYGLAITMDGAIVADFITAGTLRGDLLRAGSVSAEAISQSFKTSISNDIDAVRQEFAVADGELRSYIQTTYATKTEVSTSITQTATSIRTEVNQKVGTSEFGTYMQQNYNSFLLGFNGNSRVIQISTDGIDIYDGTVDDNNRMIQFNGIGMTIWRTGVNIGKIGTNSWTGYSDYRGLVFDLEYEGSYMTWARKTSVSSNEYTTVLTYARAGAVFQNEGLYFGCNVYANENTIDSANLTNVKAGGHTTFTGRRKFITGIVKDSNGDITWTEAEYDINNGMFIS